MCIADDASALLYGTYFGSSQFMPAEHVDGGTSRFDKQGRIYQAVCAGCGGSSSFPTTPGAYSQTNNSSNCNLAVFKIDFEIPAVISEFDMPNTVCAPATIQFTNNSLTLGPTTNFFWDFGDGTTSTSFQPDHTYSQPDLPDYIDCSRLKQLQPGRYNYKIRTGTKQLFPIFSQSIQLCR